MRCQRNGCPDCIGVNAWRRASAIALLDTQPVATTGVVRNWDAGEGWGVIDSPETPGGCWAHVSSLVGFGDLQPGQEVTFDYEPAQQDGYDFRATEVQPTSGEPDWPTVFVTGPTEAYRSRLTITFDDPD